MSPESCAERGTGGNGPTASPAQNGAQKKRLGGWDKFVNIKNNDPRSMAQAKASDRGLSIWPVSPARMNLVLDYLYRLCEEAEEKVLECLEPWSEEWRKLMDEVVKRQHSLNKEILLTAQVLALPKPKEGAMISAAKVLAEFCSDHQFPFCLQPNCHRYLENMDDVHRVLRSLLANKIVRLFLFWMPVGDDGKTDARWMNGTATAIKGLGMTVLCLGPFGLVLFEGVSDTWIKIVLLIAVAAGAAVTLMADGTSKHALVLMAVMASIVFGGRDGP